MPEIRVPLFKKSNDHITQWLLHIYWAQSIWKFALKLIGKVLKNDKGHKRQEQSEGTSSGARLHVVLGSKLIAFTDLVSCLGWRDKIYQKRL